MELSIEGKIALVSAASSGLGRASAAALAREGARVAILSRRETELQNVAQEIGAALAVRCDLSKAADIEAALQRVQSELGSVDILVNNCGGPPGGSFSTISETQWIESFEQVFLSTLRMTRAVLPGMRERRWGRIINIVSTSVQQPIPGLILSNAYRPALAGWAKTLAAEVAGDGVLVNCISPGRIRTNRTATMDRAASEQTGKSIPQIEAERSATVPMQRYGTPEEFGAVVAFLASERASYLTGSVLRVDGGLVSSI
ncbi:MAG: SDR family oxidoreductase [Bryobacterales bacterium]|nr:SDR family oxidoreductase [Bryobacterales bacterium]